MNEIQKNQNAILRRSIPLIIRESLPDIAVTNILENYEAPSGDLYILSIGKAGWQMARTAADLLKGKYKKGYLITKYDHVKEKIENFEIFEAGHPLVDENSLAATDAVIRALSDLKKEDEVLLLLSGGGSALFEKPLIPFDQLQGINTQLLKKGANIVEINTIRKRLSSVKGGKFARLVSPAHITSLILSDVVSDRPDMIASGPAYPDSSSSLEALEIIRRYDLSLSEEALACIREEPVKQLDNITTHICGGVNQLCQTAQKVITAEGYKCEIVDSALSCETKEAAEEICRKAISLKDTKEKTALIYGGETVVKVKGKGLGGRNQEMALYAAKYLKEQENITFLALASDGTDGPTDAAGGLVNSLSYFEGIDEYLNNNDAYYGLIKTDCLIKTGPTGTNVNDVAIILIN